MTSKTSLELPEITAAIVVGGIGIAASVYLYKLYHANQKPAIQLFNEGNITKAAIQEICRQIQNGESPQGDNKENALQLACRYGNIQAVNAILPLMRMEELKYVNIHGCNLIHLCGTEKDNSDILQCIITHVLQQRGGETLLQELFSTKTFDNQWTPLHLFCGKGFANCVKILLNTPETVMKIPVNEKDSNGHTALVMASANGHLECVKLLLDQPDINIYLGDSRCKTCLYFAAFNQLEEIVDLILATERAGGEEYIKKNSPEQFKIVDICDYSGNSPLHAACLKGNLSLVKKLLAHGAQINSTSVSGDSCLHLCCQRNDAKHHEILDFLCKQCSDSEFVELMKKTTSFGCSALHDAAYCGNWKAMRYLHNGRKEEFLKCLEGCDNDGLTPMLSLCRGIITYKAKKFNPDDLLKTLEELLELGCNPNGGDFAKSTCLHFLCYGTPNYEAIITAVKILLKYGADPSCEDTFGWSPLHAIYNAPPSDVTAEIIKLLETYLQEKNPEFLKSFDKKKVRNIKDRTFVEKAGPHNRIPIEERNAVLQGDFTTKGIADYIKRHLENNESMKIVVLVGAGISVNCGIPDFRSPGTGIYSKINPGQFSLEFLATAPQQFYEFVREMFGPVFKGSVKPSDTHLFLKLLSDKGLLKRLYTQNIDTIENLVGLPNELVIPAHGSFESARCATCMKPVEDMRAQFWDPIFDSEIPSCSYCGRVVRPDVVFFGENLPGRFFECHHSDLKDADLLIVMGTSLVVYPFASLVGMVPLLTPRLLINKQLTGPFTKKTSSTYRDAVYLGDCDDGINELSQYLGWSEELNALKEKRDQTSQE